MFHFTHLSTIEKQCQEAAMSEMLRGVDDLKIELQRAKEGLRDVDESIKKLTGRDPLEKRNHPRRVSLGAPVDFRGRGSFGSPVERSERPERRVRAFSGPGDRGTGDIRGRLFAIARQGIGGDEAPPVKRRIVGGAFSRLGPMQREREDPDSGEEEDVPNRHTLQSSVVATPGVIRTRKDSIELQNKDEKGKARNRRMFGLLLGTLQKFRTEANESKEKDDQRRRIEVKLEDKAKQEKENAQKERQQLFQERRDKQAQVQLLEQKMELVDMHEAWVTETLKLKNFLRTKAKPHLFYKPRSVDSGDSRIKQTHKAVDDMIKSRKKKLAEAVKELEGRMTGAVGEEEHEGGDGDEEEMEQPEKNAENKENMKRKDRKRRISREEPLEEEEMGEEDLVSVGAERSGEVGEGQGVGGDNSQGETTQQQSPHNSNDDDETHDHRVVMNSQQNETEGEPAELQKQVEADAQSRATVENDSENVLENVPVEPSLSRKVILAEDEGENSMDQSGDGDPEQADE